MNKEQPKKQEKCVLCGALTEYTQDTPISHRQAYVEGAGQLCKECYINLYITKI